MERTNELLQDMKDEAIDGKRYRKAAEQGNADAQVRLGDCYDSGHGVEQDGAKAAEWYRNFLNSLHL